MTTSSFRTSLQALRLKLVTSESLPPLGAFSFVVLLVIYMSESTDNKLPDSISYADLQKLANTAKEAEAKEKPLYSGLTEEEVWEAASEGLTLISEKCSHPIGHKVSMLIVLNNMVDWHKSIAEQLQKDGEYDAAMAWSRDAGKFQAIMNIMMTIEIGDDDFTLDA